MKKNKIFLITALFCVVSVFFLVSCVSSEQTSGSTQQPSSTSASNPNQIICKNNRFNPSTLTVKAGTTVTWINQDSYIHTATSGSSPDNKSGVFDSGNINAGETFSFTFENAGAYDYFCIPHFSLGMIGKIIVTE